MGSLDGAVTAAVGGAVFVDNAVEAADGVVDDSVEVAGDSVDDGPDVGDG